MTEKRGGRGDGRREERKKCRAGKIGKFCAREGRRKTGGGVKGREGERHTPCPPHTRIVKGLFAVADPENFTGEIFCQFHHKYDTKLRRSNVI